MSAAVTDDDGAGERPKEPIADADDRPDTTQEIPETGVASPRKEVDPDATPMASHSSRESRRFSKVAEYIPAMPGLEELTWLNDPHVWWRHPVARVFIALLIVALDMALYLEDPINDSHVSAYLPGLGHLYSFCFIWPANTGLLVLRLFLAPLALISGCIFGRQVLHHKLLRDRWKLEMFSESNGTFLVMSVGCTVTITICLLFYNLVASTEPIDADMRMDMRTFAKICQCCSVSADIVALLMIFDAVMQDVDVYPLFLPRAKAMWRRSCGGYLRVVAIWIIAVAAFTATIVTIAHTGVGDEYNEAELGGMTESGRATMVSFIVFCDLFTVAQDWDFPSFRKAVDLSGTVYIAGTVVTELRCDLVTRMLRLIPSCPRCRRLLWWLPSIDFFSWKVTGAWLTYGPLLVVMGIDLFCTKTQAMYEPKDYGQYTRGSGPDAYQVWAIRDEAYLAIAYAKGYLVRPEMVTYAARWNITTGEPINQGVLGDVKLKSQHTGLPLRYPAVLPGILMMIVFPLMVYSGNKRKSMVQAIGGAMTGSMQLFKRSRSSQGSAEPTAAVTEPDDAPAQTVSAALEAALDPGGGDVEVPVVSGKDAVASAPMPPDASVMSLSGLPDWSDDAQVAGISGSSLSMALQPTRRPEDEEEELPLPGQIDAAPPPEEV